MEKKNGNRRQSSKEYSTKNGMHGTSKISIYFYLYTIYIYLLLWSIYNGKEK